MVNSPVTRKKILKLLYLECNHLRSLPWSMASALSFLLFFPSLREIDKTQSVLSSGDDFYAGQVHRLHVYIKIVKLSTSEIGYTLPLQKGKERD